MANARDDDQQSVSKGAGDAGASAPAAGSEHQTDAERRNIERDVYERRISKDKAAEEELHRRQQRGV